MESMITIASVGVIVVALAALIWSQRQMGAVLHTLSTPQAHDTPEAFDPEPLWRSLEGLEKRTLESISALTKAVANGIDHVDRNEKRVRGMVVGAVRRFENSEYYDAGVDAELETLPIQDNQEEEAETVMLNEQPSVDGEYPELNLLVPGEY